MSAERIEQAKRNAVWARARLDTTLVALQQRLKPGNLAGEAWDGVREKGGDLADSAMEAVRRRPAAVSAVIGAFALFLARAPIKRAVTRLVAGEEPPDGRIVTTIDTTTDNDFRATAPIVDAPVSEGVA